MKTTKTKKEIWIKRIQDWRNSGLSQVEYCRQENIKLHQLTHWKSKIEGAEQAGDKSISPAASGFTRVSRS